MKILLFLFIFGFTGNTLAKDVSELFGVTIGKPYPKTALLPKKKNEIILPFYTIRVPLKSDFSRYFLDALVSISHLSGNVISVNSVRAVETNQQCEDLKTDLLYYLETLNKKKAQLEKSALSTEQLGTAHVLLSVDSQREIEVSCYVSEGSPYYYLNVALIDHSDNKEFFDYMDNKSTKNKHRKN